MIQRISSAFVKFKSLLSDSIERGLQGKLSEIVSVTDFGAKGDGVTDDAPAFQRAIDAVGWYGLVHIPKAPVDWVLKSPVRIDHAITIKGLGGSTVATSQSSRIRVHGHNHGFILVPTNDGYRFGYGVTGVTIEGLRIEGDDINTRGNCGITVDTSVNSGVYHVRECIFRDNKIRYMDHGFDIRGICYLNEWYSNRALWCGVGCRVDKVDGAAEGGSDQNRFFGNEFVLCDRALSLSETSYGGSQTIVGNTLSEGKVGLILGWNSQLCMTGNQIENNEWYGVLISIPEGVGNPASDAAKLISGNCFLFNGVDIQVEKKSTALTGGFPFSLRIESNSFTLTKTRVLAVSAPTGAGEFDSPLFIFGADNVYTSQAGYQGTVPPSMIEHDWKGYRGYKEHGKVCMSAQVEGDVPKNVMHFSVGYGHQLHVKYRMTSIPTMSSSGNTQVSAAINFTDATDPSNPTVIKTDFGREGEFILTREQVGLGKQIIVAGNANTNGSTAHLHVEYCII